MLSNVKQTRFMNLVERGRITTQTKKRKKDEMANVFFFFETKQTQQENKK